MPTVVVPGATRAIAGLSDQDGNQVYRLVVYKSQVDDCIRAFRRKQLTLRHFNYDRTQWERDNEQKSLLKEESENKQTTLNQVASDSF